MTEYWTGGSGNDYKDYTGSDNFWANGRGGNDFIWGSIGNDTLWGEYGNDTLKGWSGNDYLYGESGSDYLYGESGSDYLYGGSGKDTLDGYGSGVEYDDLWGGGDADTFVLGNAFGAYYKGSGAVLGYAAINDFDWTQGDKIQVFGSASDYTLQPFPNIGDSGVVDIYYKGERIGLVNSTADVSISRDFIFV